MRVVWAERVGGRLMRLKLVKHTASGVRVFKAPFKFKGAYIGMNRPAALAHRIRTNMRNSDVAFHSGRKTVPHELYERVLMVKRRIPYKSAHRKTLKYIDNRRR